MRSSVARNTTRLVRAPQPWASFMLAGVLALGLSSCDDAPSETCDDAQCDLACTTGGRAGGTCQDDSCVCVDAECATDDDCQDDLFCNGEERCDHGAGPEEAACAPSEEGPCLADQTCDEAVARCLSDCDADDDADDDGAAAVNCGGDDCDDTDAAVYPGAAELPGDEVDQNCDGLELCYVDGDHDGYRTDEGPIESASLRCEGDGLALESVPAGDCDDGSAEVFPGAEDLAGDELDSDCDGVERCYVDADHDGYRSADELTAPASTPGCDGDGEASVFLPAGDCDDGDEARNPSATELPADGVDQNCDGLELCYLDGDQDGYLPDDSSLVVPSEDLDCADAGEGDDRSPRGDCDDEAGLVNPGQEEVPGDERDQNCDGLELCFIDGDGDGLRASLATVSSVDLDCRDPGEIGVLSANGDCDDTDPEIHAFADERCNGLDDDCDGAVDEDSRGRALTRVCGSDVGICHTGTETCTDGVWGSCWGDGGPSTEICTTSELDEDCDGTVDEGCGCVAGETRPCGPETDAGICEFGVQTCTGVGAWGDCVGAVYPESEICDSSLGSPADDEDCDGEINEDNALGCDFVHPDLDGDGYPGTTGMVACRCGLVYTTPPDCDDTERFIYPGAPEACNSIDDDCDEEIDEGSAAGCDIYYADIDDDGFGGLLRDPMCLCAPSGIYRSRSFDDCCDVFATVHPGATSWYAFPNGCGNYDYNCDGADEARYDEFGRCSASGGACHFDIGWIAVPTIPECGYPAPYVTSCSRTDYEGFYVCSRGTSVRIQECR